MIPIIAYDERRAHIGRILSREAAFSDEIDQQVAAILKTVANEGDKALAHYARAFEQHAPRALRVPADVLREAGNAIDPTLSAIIRRAADNIRRFHEQQRIASWTVDDGDGVQLGQRIVPMDRVGLYVPGGTAFYPSSMLMNAIPAQVAGVSEIAVVSPPSESGYPHVAVLATAAMLGLEEVYTVGGAQAVAALAYGTETIPRVDKIVGPGNAYVAAAKKRVFGKVAIDSVAGPSEIVVLADATGDPAYIAADLLSQAEHDERASAVLVTDTGALAHEVAQRLSEQLSTLPRKEMAQKAIEHYGAILVCPDWPTCLDMVNELAPEHLEIMSAEPWKDMEAIRHAGAIFLGPYSTEPVGDYYAGPNHVLPTAGTARYASALSVDDFIRKQSVIAYTAERLARVGRDIVTFAEAESLTAHARAVQLRLDDLEGR